MSRGPSLQIRDFLIVGNCVAKGIRSPQQILQIFDESDERTISRDSISKLIGQYDEFLRLLPDYPELITALQKKPFATAQETKHWDDLARVAGELAKNLWVLLLADEKGTAFYTIEGDVIEGGIAEMDIYMEGMWGELFPSTKELNKVDRILAPALISHLGLNITDFRDLTTNTMTRDFIVNLELAARRRTFEGTCDICRGWY